MRVPQPLLLGILGMKLPENSLRVGPARILVRDFPDFPKMMGPMKFRGVFSPRAMEASGASVWETSPFLLPVGEVESSSPPKRRKVRRSADKCNK